MSAAANPFNIQLESIQVTILVIQVFLMTIGGCIFGLGVGIRPILRLTQHDSFYTVRSICDLMVSIGVWQIISAGFDSLSACWKLIWPLYLAMGMTLITILVEMLGIVTSFYVLSHISDIVDEQIYRAWFIWECKGVGSCESAFKNYIYHYMMPQVGLVVFAIILQCLSILYLSRCVRCLNAKKMRIWKSREDLLNHVLQRSFDSTDVQHKKTKDKPSAGNTTLHESIISSPGLYDSFSPTNEPPPDDNSVTPPIPNSILKGDHGYLMASNSSLNFDDSYNHQSQLENQKGTSSISFNTSVLVHYFDANNMPNSSNNNYNPNEAHEDNLNNNLPNCPYPAVEATNTDDVTVRGSCTEAAAAAGLCANTVLKSSDGSRSSGAIHEDARNVDVSTNLSKIFTTIRGSNLRSRRYSFVDGTPPDPISTLVELSYSPRNSAE